MIQSTTDCLQEANDILREAKHITTRKEHAEVWDRKANLLNTINNAFETGFYSGEAYNELQEAKIVLLKAETIAGDRASETYAKGEF